MTAALSSRLVEARSAHDHDWWRREGGVETEGRIMLLTGIRCLLRGHELVQETDRDQTGRIERIRLSCIHCGSQLR